MKRSLLVLALTSLLVLPAALFAQDEAEEERDNLELNFYGGLSMPTGGIKDYSDTLGAKSGLGGGLDFGVFISSQMTLGVGFAYSQFDIDNDNELVTHKHKIYRPNLYLRYYLPSSSDLVPYAHVRVGLDFANLSTEVVDNGTRKLKELEFDPALSAGFGAGLFYYTSDYSGFFVQADYHQAFSKSTKGDFQGVDYEMGDSYGTLDLRIGLHLLFGSGE
ncbi:MAG: outer membrane beta-barrel protein [bacterium]|nr:outer membrane beta-barrel protein [bacterium]